MGYKRTIGILLAVILMMVSGCSSKKTVLPLAEAVKMSEEQLKAELAGFSRDEIVAAWGEPVGMLSGLYGDIFCPELGKSLLLYYKNDGSTVEEVRIGEEGLKTEGTKFEGTILEIHDTSAVVEVDEGFPIRGSGTQVSVSLKDAETPAAAGDRVRVTYDGNVLETDPLQLENQLSIQILDDGQEAGENWDARVAEAIISENQGMYAQGECVAEGHMILETEQKETETKLYVLTMYGEYQFQNGNFVKEAGSGVIPAVLVFQRGEGDEHILSSYEVPEDGNGYVESIQKLFPKHLQEICISPTEEVRDALKDQERRYASEYLETLGRTAKIGDYRDFEYPLLTDAGVSVEVSNRMVENKELGVYPYWIGSEEKLEDGVRYVYQMDYDPEKKQILYTKTEYDTGAVKETYIFNSETGEPES